MHIKVNTLDHRFNGHVILTNFSLYRKNHSVPWFLTMKTLIQNFDLTNTALNEFLIMSNKNVGFLIKFYHGFSERYHTFELRSLFPTFESLKSVEIPIYAVV